MSDVASNRESLDSWLGSQTDFPRHGGVAYPTRLQGVTEYLNGEVHPQVEKGPLVTGEGFMTDHGPEHVLAVVERAGDLLAHPVKDYPQLTAYEVYLLLMAIQFHDVGNLFGRKEHEAKIAPVMERMHVLVGDEMVEKRAIRKIAEAHGGVSSEGNRDTIIRLAPEEWILSRRIRPQALAAILRFADELSDDSRRVARVPMETGTVPDQSRRFHMYSGALHSVRVEPEQHIVFLRYCFTKNEAGPLRSGNSSTYLVDEIYERTIKMHYEREYCMRFTRGLVQIDAIDVQIDIY